MADTKTNEIKTRISLKYDTLANWQTNNPTLLQGEVAFVQIGDVTTDNKGNRVIPPIMFKVGPGAFNDLGWGAATAADVYGWAKKSAPDWADFSTIPGAKIGLSVTEETGTNDGGYVNGLTWDENTKTLKPAVVNFDSIIDDTTKNSTNAPQTKAVKAYVDAEVAKAISGGVEGLATEEYVNNAIADLSKDGGAIKTVADDLADLKAKVEDEDGALDRANAAYTLAEGKTTMAEVEGKGYAVASEVDNKLANKVDKVIGKSLVDDDEITKLATIAEGAQVNVIETVKVNGTALSVSDKAVDVTVPTEDQIKTLAADEIGRLIDASGDAETLKSIGDLVDYAEKNAGDIAQLITNVETANTNASNAVNTANGAASNAAEALEKAEEALEGAEGATASAAAAKTSEEAAAASAGAAADSATAASASANTASSAASTASGHADTASQKATDAANSATAAATAQGKAEDAQSAAEAAQEAAEAARDEAVNSNTSATAIANEAKGTADAAKEASEAATATVAGLHAIATSGNIADLEQDTNTYVVFNCGSASTVI